MNPSSDNTYQVLLVILDEAARERCADWLLSAGYGVSEATGVDDCEAIIGSTRVDLIVFRSVRPESSDDAIRTLRNKGLSCPILLLAAYDRVESWSTESSGRPDDYLLEPFARTELLGRVELQLLKSITSSGLVKLSHCEVDLSGCVVKTDKGTTRLTPIEQALLAYFFLNPGRAISRDELLREVWEYRGGVVSRAVDHAVKRLRAKLEKNPKQPVHILTVHGVGYRFDPPAEPTGSESARFLPASTTSSVPRDQLPNGHCIASLTEEELPVRFGRYTLHSVLGVGGMGRLFEATLHGPAGFEKPIALKMISYKKTSRKLLRQELINEARVGGLLKHPNVVDVYDFGEIQDQFFIAMELVEGLGLGECLRMHGALPVGLAIEIACQLCAGVAYAHEFAVRGKPLFLIHRDIKPSNILLSHDGVVKLMDFGLVKAQELTRHDAEREVVGTPSFMSPEQIAGETIDQRSDLFAVGVVISTMLLGRNIFRGKTVPVTLSRLTQADQTLEQSGVVSEMNVLFKGVGDVVRRCLAANPEERFARARDLEAALLEIKRAVPLPGGLRGWLGNENVAPRTPPVTDLLDSGSTASFHSDHPERSPWEGSDALSSSISLLRNNNLPSDLDSFVGRQTDLTRLEEIFDLARLCTVLGPGGMGKTRLCQRFAQVVSETKTPRGGVWFCDLSHVREQSQLNEVMVPILGLSSNEQLDSGVWITTCAAAIAEKGPCLFVLDNAEQVVSSLAPVLAQWLKIAPEARFLVTSRERLGLGGEVTHVLRPLDSDEGVRLFCDRARSLRTDFSLSDDDVTCIRSIVERVDGMPLAIELAASRVRMLSLPRLLDGLSERLVLLRSNRRDVSERQKTMWGAISWSWELLEPWEQTCLAQLTAFQGGFTLEAADDVIDLSAHPEAPWVAFVVESLLEKSLVRSVRPGAFCDQVRFDMYGTIRDYAQQCLPADADGARARHSRYWARFSDPAVADGLGPLGSTKRARVLQLNLDNLQAAATWALDAGETKLAVGACIVLSEPLLSCAPSRLAGWIQRVLALDDLFVNAEISLLRILGQTWERRGNREKAVEVLQRALGLARQEKVGTSSILSGLARQQIQLGQHDLARPVIGEAVDMMLDEGEPQRALCFLGNVVTLQQLLGRFEDAKPHVRRLLSLQGRDPESAEDISQVCELTLQFLRTTDNRRFQGTLLNDLGVIQFVQGDVEKAEATMKEAIEVAREVGNRVGEIVGCGNLGDLYLRGNQFEKARAHLEEALRMSREIGYSLAEGAYLASLAELALRTGDLQRAGLDFSTAELLLREVGDPIELCKFLARRGHLGLAMGCENIARGSLDEAVAIVEEVGAGPGSELCQMIRVLKEAVEAGGPVLKLASSAGIPETRNPSTSRYSQEVSTGAWPLPKR